MWDDASGGRASRGVVVAVADDDDDVDDVDGGVMLRESPRDAASSSVAWSRRANSHQLLRPHQHHLGHRILGRARVFRGDDE